MEAAAKRGARAKAALSSLCLMAALTMWPASYQGNQNLVTANKVSPAGAVLFPGDQKQPPRQQQQAQNERLNLIEADDNGIYLLGLFDIHQSNARIPFKCGPIDVDVGEWHSRRAMQNMEAFLWAIEQVNADKSLLPGVKLGSLVMDTCSSFLRTNQQLANLLHGNQSPGANLNSSRQIAALVADNSDWQSVEAVVSIASAASLTTIVSQSKSSKLGELGRRYAKAPSASLLAEMLGVAKMTPLASGKSPIDHLNSTSWWQPTGEHETEHLATAEQRLLMVRMLLGNEVLAEALASLLQQMNWDLVSLVYDDEPDSVDLHDELARQLFARNLQLAADEQLPLAAPPETYDRLLQALAKRSSSMGAHVVVSLLSTGSARLLLEASSQLRGSSESSAELKSQLSSLLWVGVGDREPYYAMATEALGSVLVSGAVSLMPEFKAHYDGLGMESNGARNRWWSEFMRSVMLRNNQRGQPLELTANECAKWLEPKASPLHEKCRNLSIGELLKLELASGRASKDKPQAAKQRVAKLAKYLAGGWEHNGMDVINSVLTAANGLESLRQALCPGRQQGLCDRMRELVRDPVAGQPVAKTTLSELMHQELLRSTFQLADGRMFNLDELSQPMGQVDGRLKYYNLRYVQPNSIGFVKFGHYSQLEGLELNVSKAVHYQLAKEQSSSSRSQRDEPIELVKSSCSDANKCLILGAVLPQQQQQQESHESRTNGGSGAKQANSTIPSASLPSGSNRQTNNAISEEELAASLNSLFKLEHPVFSGQEPVESGQQQTDRRQEHKSSMDNNNNNNKGPSIGPNNRRGTRWPEDPLVQSMRSAPSIGKLNWKSQLEKPDNESQSWQASADALDNGETTLNVIVLLPLHKPTLDAGSGRTHCAETIDLRHSFQWLAALAFGQQQANAKLAASLSDHHHHHHAIATNKSEANGHANGASLTTTVIDYCQQHELALAKLKQELAAEKSSAKTVAVLDFEPELADKISARLADSSIVQLSLGSAVQQSNQQQQQLRINMVPSKTDEIGALVKLVGWHPSWRLVHLIYTDSHLSRDEFVRQANLEGVCVSKLIWVPSEQTTGENHDLEAMRRLFAGELHDFSSSAINESEETQGLNSTRVIILLASSNEATNRMILEAASESMLNDYVWITSHEWLSSVERPLEMEQEQQVRLPRHLLSTKLETIESHKFREFYSGLTPALHSPLPTTWFDQFWQQHFRCRLPMSGSSVSGDTTKVPLCSLNLRLNSDGLEDELVHYAIEAMEALGEVAAKPLDEATSFMRRLKDALELKRQSATGGYAFSVVHRLTDTTADAARMQIEGTRRRANSRNLNADETRGQLVRVGGWRHCCGLTMFPSDRNYTDQREHSFWRQASELLSEATEDGDQKVHRSLYNLRAIESECRAKSTCQLCSVQIGQTQDRESLAQFSRFGPHAISSIAINSAQEQNEPIKASDLPSEQPNQELDANNSSEPMEAAASSLFDRPTLNQLDQTSRPTRSRTMSKSSSGRWTVGYSDTSGQHQSELNPRRMTGLLVFVGSLGGVLCVVATITYLHPKLTSGDFKVDGEDDSQSLASKSSSLMAHKGASLDNADDYFLLAGLLMLFSINFAFLLPATVGVCWFRRVGLATGFTLIFSSILVKVLMSRRKWTLWRGRSGQLAPATNQEAGYQGRVTPGAAEQIDDCVEVTFESLTHEQGPQSHSSEAASGEPEPESDPDPEPRATSNSAVSRYRHSVRPEQQQQVASSARPRCLDLASDQLTLPTCLVLGQLLVSLLWFLEQPPEPTLYLGCWHCASPVRSPTMFLYGSLLSLLFPATLLVITWILSVLAFRGICQEEQRFRRALIGLRRQTSGISSQHDTSNQRRQRQLEAKLRDAKLLVLTSSSIVLIWSMATLKTISNNRRLPVMPHHLTSEAFATGSRQQPDDLCLVISNLLSGTIIFVLLFVYRLRIFTLRSSCCSKLSSQSNSGALLADAALRIGGQRSSVLKFNQNSSQESKWFDESAGRQLGQSASQSSFFASSTGHERLRLQQFSSYGTYANSEPTLQDSGYHTSTTINPLHLQNQRANDGKSARRKVAGQRRSSPVSLFFGSVSKKRSIVKLANRSSDNQAINKLQRRQSANSMTSSVASSTARLVASDNRSLGELNDDEDDIFDTISCASSVASSSTSQLQGNDLYPIDCSMQPLEGPSISQLDSQLVAGDKFSRRSSARRSILGPGKAAVTKLGSVSEEQSAQSDPNAQQQQQQQR